MSKIVNVEFRYEEGEHSTTTHTSGNPGSTTFPQYWVDLEMSDGTTASINLKNDFKDIFQGKRITFKRRNEIETLIISKKQSLKGVEVGTQEREFSVSRTEHWQKSSYSQYDKLPYNGLDDNSFEKIKNVLEDELKSIVN